MSRLIPYNRGSNGVSGSDPFFHMLDDFFSDVWTPRRSLYYDTFKVDVKEDENAYTVEAEMPGISKEEIEILLQDERLTISLTHDESKEATTEQYLHRERKHSSMSRSLYLAEAAQEGIKAKLEDGVLRIWVPKEQRPQGCNQIEIE